MRSHASGAAALLYWRPLRHVPRPDCVRGLFRSWARHRAIFTKSGRPPFFQPFQDRHEFHRDRHNDPKSGGARLFHHQRDQCRGNSAGLERGASGHQAEPGSDLSAGCAPDRGVLDLVPDKAFSLQPASCARAGSIVRCSTPSPRSSATSCSSSAFSLSSRTPGFISAALAVFAGAVGVGVGFGLQNIASNFISGLVILAERPITIGDRVEVAGIAGQVEQIRARSTVILTNDNIMMIVPNTKFIDSPVTNWTYGDPRVRFRIPVGVAYGSDVEKVRDALLAAAGRKSAHAQGSGAERVSREIRRELRSILSWSSGAVK